MPILTKSEIEAKINAGESVILRSGENWTIVNTLAEIPLNDAAIQEGTDTLSTSLLNNCNAIIGIQITGIPSNGQILAFNSLTNRLEWMSGIGGVNNSLSNLSNVSINTSLISDTDNIDDLGTPTNRWKNLYLGGFIGDGSGNELLKFSSSGVPKIGFLGATAIARTAAYTPTNVTPDRSYDANSTTLDEVASVLGTLITDLQGFGLLG